MRLKNINGRPVNKNVNKKRINWNTKSKSNLQFTVKSLLKPHWENHVVYEEFNVYGTRLTLDFYNATKNIAIEVQGIQHTKFTPYFHGNHSNFLHQIKKDEMKRLFCNLNNIKLIEIFEEEQKKLSEKFLKEIGLI